MGYVGPGRIHPVELPLLGGGSTHMDELGQLSVSAVTLVCKCGFGRMQPPNWDTSVALVSHRLFVLPALMQAVVLAVFFLSSLKLKHSNTDVVVAIVPILHPVLLGWFHAYCYITGILDTLDFLPSVRSFPQADSPCIGGTATYSESAERMVDLHFWSSVLCCYRWLCSVIMIWLIRRFSGVAEDVPDLGDMMWLLITHTNITSSFSTHHILFSSLLPCSI